MVLWIQNLSATWQYSLMLRLPGIDKALHFFQSFILCVVLGVLLRRTRLSPVTGILLASAVVLAASGADEFQQSLRVDRSVETADVIAAASGTIAGVATLIGYRSIRLAASLGVLGLALGAGVVYESHLRTREYSRGVLAEREGRAKDAVGHYLAAITADPDNPEAYNAAAWSIAESGHGDPEQAVELAERSLNLRPANADTLDTYGWALFRAGRAADALGPLQAALAVKPEIYCIHYHLGAVYMALDRKEEGTRHLRLQAELMPDTREAQLARALLSASAHNSGTDK